MSEVLVVGNIHFDRMIKVDAFPQPGETIVARQTWSQLGGKGANQAAASAKIATTHLCSAVGNDHEGQQIRQALNNFSVISHLHESNTQPTGSSVALIDAAGENVGIINPAANQELSAQAVQIVMDEVNPALLVCQWETKLETLQAVLEAAAERQIPSLMNAAPWHDDYRPLLALVSHVVVNEVEAESWLGQPVKELPKHLNFGHPSVIVTLGARGASHYLQNTLQVHLPAQKVEALSTHGAGDHYVGTLASHLAAGDDLTSALRQAGDAAAQFVQQLHKPAYSLT